MSWECPYNIKNYCKRLKKICQPGIKGCILYGQVKTYDKPEIEKKTDKPENKKI